MSQQIIEKILSNTATPAEKKQFEDWLNESTDNQGHFNKTKLVWDRLDKAFSTKKFDKQAARLKVDERINSAKAKQFRFQRRRQLAIAATFFVLVGISLFMANKIIQNNQFNQQYTSTNTVKEVLLSDGSHVWLNKNSTLMLPKNFSRNDRTVSLKGEAYFEVKRDETKPFKVLAGKTITKVLGTSFNIEMDTLTGNVTLNVKSGKVAFNKRFRNVNHYTLTVGAYAQYLKAENRIIIKENESLNFLAWKTGRLQFYDTPLSQVCKDLSKFYDVPIEAKLNDETILTGTFDHETLTDVLAIIRLSLGVKINEDDGKYTLIK